MTTKILIFNLILFNIQHERGKIEYESINHKTHQ